VAAVVGLAAVVRGVCWWRPVRAGGLWLARRGRWRLARLKGEEAENQKPPKQGFLQIFFLKGGRRPFG